MNLMPILRTNSHSVYQVPEGARTVLGELACLGTCLVRVLAGFMAKPVEIEPSIVVLLTMSSTGAPIINLDGEIQGHYTLVWNQ